MGKPGKSSIAALAVVTTILALLAAYDLAPFIAETSKFEKSEHIETLNRHAEQLPKDFTLIYGCPESRTQNIPGYDLGRCLSDALADIKTIEGVYLMASIVSAGKEIPRRQELKDAIQSRLNQERHNLLASKGEYFKYIDNLVRTHNESLILVAAYGKKSINSFDWYADSIDEAELQLEVPDLLHRQRVWRLQAYIGQDSLVKK